MSTASRNGTLSEMNLTPLIDVLLVLLIIFMVVLPLRNVGEKTDIPMPSTTESVWQPARIVIQLHDSGKDTRPAITVNQHYTAWNELESRLQYIYRDRSEHIAFLQGDPEIDFQYVAEAVDIAHQAGATRVGLLGRKR